jgi:hypothetical protein
MAWGVMECMVSISRIIDAAVSLSRRNKFLLSPEAAEKLIINLLLVAALLLASTVSVMTNISSDEMTAGNVIALAQGSVAFRCKFFPNATYHPCRGSFDPKSCDKPPMCPTYGARHFGTGVCASENFHESFELAKNADPTAVMSWVNEIMPNTYQLPIIWDWNAEFPTYLSHLFGTCLPSSNMATFGFQSVLWNMVAVFLSLFLYMTLTFARDADMFDWWWVSTGFVGCLIVFIAIIKSSYTFMQTIEFVVNIRFPLPQEHCLWAVFTMDTVGIIVRLVFPFIIFGSYLFLTILRILTKNSAKSNDGEPPIPSYPDSCPTWKLHKATMDAEGFDFDLFRDLPHPSSYMFFRLGDELQNLGVPLGHRLKMIHELHSYTEKDRMLDAAPAGG